MSGSQSGYDKVGVSVQVFIIYVGVVKHTVEKKVFKMSNKV
jgi:hypothetical protein